MCDGTVHILGRHPSEIGMQLTILCHLWKFQRFDPRRYNIHLPHVHIHIHEMGKTAISASGRVEAVGFYPFPTLTKDFVLHGEVRV